MYKGDKWTCRFSLLWLYITLNYLGRIHRVTFAELMNEYRKQTFRHLAAKLHNQLAPRLGNAEEQHHFEKLPGIPSGEKDGPSPGMWSLISHTAHYLPALPSPPPHLQSTRAVTFSNPPVTRRTGRCGEGRFTDGIARPCNTSFLQPLYTSF